MISSRPGSRFTIELAVPPQTAFTFLADPRHRPRWQSSLRAVELIDPGPPRVGMRWVDHTAVRARPRLEIVELVPPNDVRQIGAWSETGEWAGLHARLRLTFAPLDDGARTLLGVDLHIDSSWPWLPARLVLQALAPAAVRADLRRAGRVLERLGG